MKKYHGLWLLVVLGGLLLIGAALASCAPDTSAPELQARVDVAQVPEDQPVAETAPIAETGVDVAPFTDVACLDCHTDEERVKELAVEPEAVEAPSSGPG